MMEQIGTAHSCSHTIRKYRCRCVYSNAARERPRRCHRFGVSAIVSVWLVLVLYLIRSTSVCAYASVGSTEMAKHAHAIVALVVLTPRERDDDDEMMASMCDLLSV